jgi:hypothetical protein
MSCLLRTSWIVFCWIPLVGVQASIAQGSDLLPSGPSPSQEWKSCATGLSDQELAKSLDAQVTRPQNITQFLQNLRLAWQNDWLLQPDFYDEKTLMKFFDSVSITWKQTQDKRSPAEEIALETSSQILPQMSIVLQIHCRSRTYPQPNGLKKTIRSIGGNFRIYGAPVPDLTLAVVRQVLGPETRNERAFAGMSEVDDSPPAIKGSVVYTDPAKEKLEGQRMGLTFEFTIPTNPAGLDSMKIEPADVVQSIGLSAGRNRVSEN